MGRMNVGELGPELRGVPHLLVTTGTADRGTLLKMEVVPALTSLALKTAASTPEEYRSHLGVRDHLELPFRPLGIYGFFRICKMGRSHRQDLDSALRWVMSPL